MKKRANGSGDLDVVELLAEDPDFDDEADLDLDPTTDNRRVPPWVIGVAVLVVAALVAFSILAGDPKTDEAAPTPTTRPAPPSTAGTTNELPEFGPGAFVDGLDAPLALSRASRVFQLHPESGDVEPLGVFTAGATAVAAAGNALLVADNRARYVIDENGDAAQFGSTRLFPAGDGRGFWQDEGDLLTPFGFDANPISLPPDVGAVAALADGFLLQADAGDSPLTIWTPGGVPQPIDDSEGALVAAVHPNRIAWYDDVPGRPRLLSVTDTASGRTLSLPGVLPLFADGRATGRFSADATFLALQVDVPSLSTAELVVVDLETGAIVTREPFGNPPIERPGHPFELPVAFDFSADGERLTVSQGSALRLVSLDLATGARADGPADATGITSIVTLGVTRVAPPTPLADRIAAAVDTVIGSISPNGVNVDIVDLGAGTRQRLTLPVRVSDTAPAQRWTASIVSLADGFVATTGTTAYWIPRSGDAVELGPAVLVVPDTNRQRAWLFNATADGGWDVASVDGHSGAVRAERHVLTYPVAVVDGEFIRVTSGTFETAGGIELWNIATGKGRNLDIPQTPSGLVATDHYLLGRSDFCPTTNGRCPFLAIDIETGTTKVIETNADAYAAPNSTTGDIAYLYSGSDGIVRLNAADGTVEAVPDSQEGGQWWVAADGTLLMSTSAGISAWTPGMPEPVLISGGDANFEFSSAIAVL